MGVQPGKNFEPDGDTNWRDSGGAESLAADQRGGTGHETDGPESDATAAHSSRGFRRALFKSGTSGSLPDKLSSLAKTPSVRQRFAQGKVRHGLHLGNTNKLDAAHGKPTKGNGNGKGAKS